MSLTALAIRLATVRALRGRTLAGDAVLDSKISPAHLVAQEKRAPVIIVSTDDDDIEIVGKDLRTGNHRLEVSIVYAITDRVQVEADDGETTEMLSIPASDAGLEASLNVIGWQILRELSAGGGEWGDLWRVLVTRTHGMTVRRGADDEGGVRYAARQLVLTVDHVAEPTPGEQPDERSAWGRVLAAMRADQELEQMARIIDGQVVAGEYLPWQVARGHLGIPDDVSELVGIKPIKIDTIEPLAAVDMSDGFTLDGQTADEVDGPEG